MTARAAHGHAGPDHSIRAAWYRGFVVSGNLVGLAIGGAMAAQRDIDTGAYIAASLCFLALALVGSRLWYVALHPKGFRRNWRTIFDTNRPGGAVDGGVAVALLSAPLVLAAFQLPAGDYFDAALFWLLPAVALGRFGCLAYGCCAGRPTDSWFGLMLPDHHGTLRRRIPSQILESLLGAILFVLALIVRLPHPGQLFALVIGLYALGRLGLWFTREKADTGHSMRLKFGLWAVFLAGAVLTVLFAA